MKNKRTPLSKKTRFDVFKRDEFICQYCGNTPPKVVLEIDHIEPVSTGGENDIDNLLTACFDCNRGKGAVRLSTIPKLVKEKSHLIIEQELQLKEFRKIQRNKKARLNRDIKKLEAIYGNHFSGWSFTQTFKQSIRFQFLPKLDIETLKDNLTLACDRIDDPEMATKYFCGINWNQIRGVKHG